MKKYKYKFSVVVPVYNVENYLEETIESVINQTIGFENIQLILINDGSTDQSEKICLKYKNMYPNNIIYKKQKNSGVSVARNYGIKYIKGKYVSFLDGDDKWEKSAFKKLYQYFEKHYDEIDFVDCRVRLFDGDNRFYIFDYKYKKTQIIDANKQNQWTLLNAPTAIYKADVVKQYNFDERLSYSEDTKFINQILIRKCKYGIKHDAIYLYRKHLAEESAVDKRFEKKKYFVGPLEYCFKELIDASLKQYHTVVPAIQTLVLNNLIWRSKIKETKDVLTKKEFNNYLKTIKQILIYIDDKTIINRNKDVAARLWLLKLKNGSTYLNQLQFKTDYIYIDNQKFAPSRKLNIRNLRIEDGKLILHGRFVSYDIEEKIELYFKMGKQIIYAEPHCIKLWNQYSIDGEIIERVILYRVELPLLKRKNMFTVFTKINNIITPCRCSSVGKFALSPHYKSFYAINKKAIIINNYLNLIVEKYTSLNWMICWIKRNIDLLKKGKLKTLYKKTIGQALKYLKSNYYKMQNIIILESNPDFSDNTKALYEILIKKKVNDKYKILWFVNNPEEFESIKVPNVDFCKFFDAKNSSFKCSDQVAEYYKHAKIIIDENKFIKKYNKKQIRIHLNHGSPFKDAIAYNTNIGDVNAVIVQSKFFINAESKTKDIDKEKIYPLGFPRNDVLYKKCDFSFPPIDDLKGKIILWLPTYRNHKSSKHNQSAFVYGLPCINTEDELLSLNNLLKKKKMFIVIKFHPAENIKKLMSIKLSNIKIIHDEDFSKYHVTLYELFTKVDALITDYSSVYFDFCLTKKNIGLAISDIDNYVKEQGNFQYKYEDVMVGNYMYNNKDLLKFVEDVAEGRDRTYDKRMQLVDKYDDYHDGKAAERVYDFIKKFL